MKRLSSRYEVALLALIVTVAMFFRTFRLDVIPRGMTADEATHGLAALAIARGESYPIFLRGMFGALPMHAYLMAALFRALGASIHSARATAALIGIVTVPFLYLLCKELFPSADTKRKLLVIPPLATYLLATSYWHVVYSRIAIEPILVPLFGTLILYCLVRARRSGQRRFFVVCGLATGLALYTYPAANFLPLLVLVLLSYYRWHDSQFLRTHGINLVILFGVCLVVAAPLVVFAASNLDAFTARARSVSILNMERAGAPPLAAFLMSVVKTTAMYTLRGDTSPVYNPAGRPVLDPVTSALFVLGLLVAARRWREPSHFLLLVWLILMSLPGALTAGDVPHFSRTIGALPASCILPAVGLSFAWEWLGPRTASYRRSTVLVPLILSASVAFTALATYRDYFVTWDTQQDLQEGYDGAYTAAATVMNETRVPDSVWILPLTSFVPSGYGGDHFDFLYKGDTPYYTISLDEATAPQELSRACIGKRAALVVDWREYTLHEAYKAMAADPKGLVPFLLRKYGREVDRTAYKAFDIVTCQLPESPTFSIAANFETASVNFGNELMLVGTASGGSSLQYTTTPEEAQSRQIPSGKSGWVVLQWRALSTPSRNYKVAVYLRDQGGHIAGQVDKLLLGNYLHPTRDWQPGQEEMDYYTLPSWAGTAPGWYRIGVTVYDAESSEPLAIVGGAQTYELATIEIVKPLAPGEVRPEVAMDQDVGELAPEIRLLGYDLPRRELNPGDEFSVALYWQALEDVQRDYLLAVQLTNERGRISAEGFAPPLYGTYPTTEWSKGEIVKDWHDVSLAADTAQGTYQVSVRISEDDRLVQGINLEPVGVSGRPRQFRVPEIAHPVDARLGEGIRLLGYDLGSDEVRPGQTLLLTLYWQAMDEMDTSYTVFTHLLDAQNRIYGQRDSVPGAGTLPTTSWVEGEIISDGYEITLDPEAPPGTYVIEIGMYDSGIGTRLPVYRLAEEGVTDHIILRQIEVAGGR